MTGEQLASDEIIYRAIWPVLVKETAEYKFDELGPATFARKLRNQRLEPGLSVAWAKKVRRDEFISSIAKRNKALVRVAKSDVGSLQALGYKVFYTPTSSHDWHCSIRCSACDLNNWDCLLVTGEDCQLSDLVSRVELSDAFQIVES